MFGADSFGGPTLTLGGLRAVAGEAGLGGEDSDAVELGPDVPGHVPQRRRLGGFPSDVADVRDPAALALVDGSVPCLERYAVLVARTAFAPERGVWGGNEGLARRAVHSERFGPEPHQEGGFAGSDGPDVSPGQGLRGAEVQRPQRLTRLGREPLERDVQITEGQLIGPFVVSPHAGEAAAHRDQIARRIVDPKSGVAVEIAARI